MRKLPSHLENPIDNIFYYFVEKTADNIYKKKITPNQITTVGNVFGIIGLYLLYKKMYLSSALFYALRYFFDCLDGYYARTHNLVTIFGDYYDHYSDLIIFMSYLWVLFLNNQQLFKYALIIIAIVLFLSCIHLYYQEIYYENIQDSPTINFIQKFIPSSMKPKSKKELEQKLKYSRFFGCGTLGLTMTIIIVCYYFFDKK
jgi:phosphatidylglycerophosphate synthase